MPTPEERIARVEARLDAQDKWLASIDKKLDEVIAAMNMGKGAWLAVLKMGALIMAIGAVAAFLADKLHFWK